jgi:hypothetical protein
LLALPYMLHQPTFAFTTTECQSLSEASGDCHWFTRENQNFEYPIHVTNATISCSLVYSVNHRARTFQVRPNPPRVRPKALQTRVSDSSIVCQLPHSGVGLLQDTQGTCQPKCLLPRPHRWKLPCGASGIQRHSTFWPSC